MISDTLSDTLIIGGRENHMEKDMDPEIENGLSWGCLERRLTVFRSDEGMRITPDPTKRTV